MSGLAAGSGLAAIAPVVSGHSFRENPLMVVRSPKATRMELCFLTEGAFKYINNYLSKRKACLCSEGTTQFLRREETAIEGLIAEDKPKQVDPDQDLRQGQPARTKSQQARAAELVARQTSKPVTTDLMVIPHL